MRITGNQKCCFRIICCGCALFARLSYILISLKERITNMSKRLIQMAIMPLVFCVSLVLITALAPVMTAQAAGNPIIKSIFTADPESHCWPTNPTKLYIYPSHDPYPQSGCNNMDMYHVYSTENMVDFVDEGEILRRSDLNGLSWITTSTNASSFMWAPDCAYKDGWYYFYNPVPRNVGSWGSTWETSVVRSRYPDRGFEQIPASAVDANPGKPWLGYIRDSGSTDGYSNMYDVCVRVYDGEAYIYNGAAQTLWQGKLKDDMVTVVGGKMQLVSTDNRTTADNAGDPDAYNRFPNYHEGPSAFRRKGPDGNWMYYLLYPVGPSTGGLSGDSFRYATSDGPLGPWTVRGTFFNSTGCGTSHGSITEFKGKWYWTYHTQDLSNVGELRSVGMEEVIFNADGTIRLMSKSTAGVVQDGPDYVRPATDYVLGAAQAVLGGTGTRPTLATDESAGNGGQILSGCGANNTTITFNNVDGGSGNRARLIFHYASSAAATGTNLPKLNLFVNGLDYKSVNFPGTGGNSNYVDIQFTTRPLNAGPTNTIELRGYNLTSRINLNYIEVILFDDSLPPPGYFNLTVDQMTGGTAKAKWLQQEAGANLSVAAGSKVTLSYEEGAGEFDGWEVITPTGLEIVGNTFYMPYGEVRVKPIFNNAGNARRPIIEAEPNDVQVIQGFGANLSVGAIIKDAGVLSYQWFVNTTASNTGGTSIPGAQSAAYNAPTANVGTLYYYVVITNTNNAAVGPVKTATVTSRAVTVRVDPPPSTECNVVSVDPRFTINGTNITGAVSVHGTNINLNEAITVSDKATWVLYSNPEYTTEVNKIVSPLLSGDNVRYIRVTAEDKITKKDYVITITRLTSTIGKFATPVPMDGSVYPADWGTKVYTLAEGADGINLNSLQPSGSSIRPVNFTADIYMAYDASNIYLGMVATDPYWMGAPTTNSNLWQGCGIQLMIWNSRGSGANSEYGFAINTAGNKAHNQWTTASGAAALASSYSNYNITRISGTDKFMYTIAIPLSSFRSNAASNPLAAGQELWFSICYNFPNGSGNISYAFDMGFHSKSLNDARPLVLGADIPLVPEILKGTVSGSTVSTVTTRISSIDDSVLYLAAYDASGALKKLESFTPVQVGRQDISVNFDVGTAATIKAFLWEKNTMKPLAIPKEIY